MVTAWEGLLIQGILPIIKPRSNLKLPEHPDYRRLKDRYRIERMLNPAASKRQKGRKETRDRHPSRASQRCDRRSPSPSHNRAIARSALPQAPS